MNHDEHDPLGFVGACPTCQSAYPCANVRLLKQTAEQTMFHLTCEHCQHAMLFCVARRKDGVLCSGVMTDCTFEDAQRFHVQEEVTLGDVIGMHEHFDQTWRDLFSKSPDA